MAPNGGKWQDALAQAAEDRAGSSGEALVQLEPEDLVLERDADGVELGSAGRTGGALSDRFDLPLGRASLGLHPGTGESEEQCGEHEGSRMHGSSGLSRVVLVYGPWVPLAPERERIGCPMVGRRVVGKGRGLSTT